MSEKLFRSKKKLNPWLRGAFIEMSIAAILILLVIIEVQEYFYRIPSDMGGPIMWILVVISYPVAVIYTTFISNLGQLSEAIILIFSLLIYHFAFGALLGFVAGKIVCKLKTKKNQATNK